MQWGAMAPVVDVSTHTSDEEDRSLPPRHFDANRIAHAARASVAATSLHLHVLCYVLVAKRPIFDVFAWPCFCVKKSRPLGGAAVVVAVAGRPTLRRRDCPPDLGKVLSSRNMSTDSRPPSLGRDPHNAKSARTFDAQYFAACLAAHVTLVASAGMLTCCSG